MSVREARETAVRQGYLRGMAARRSGLSYTEGIGTMDLEHGKHAQSFRKAYGSGWYAATEEEDHNGITLSDEVWPGEVEVEVEVEVV